MSDVFGAKCPCCPWRVPNMPTTLLGEATGVAHVALRHRNYYEAVEERTAIETLTGIERLIGVTGWLRVLREVLMRR